MHSRTAAASGQLRRGMIPFGNSMLITLDQAGSPDDSRDDNQRHPIAVVGTRRPAAMEYLATGGDGPGDRLSVSPGRACAHPTCEHRGAPQML
jgi:hypothetical protein